ncbi:hypothetical protein [Caballeronia arationis]|uniref:hypothetical protein n=1 Tax=Caballeronia arationis TaxID=1777142 RepID=UPI000AEAAFE3|nr:hypothetical protein [Caballeronia arationis]
MIVGSLHFDRASSPLDVPTDLGTLLYQARRAAHAGQGDLSMIGIMRALRDDLQISFEVPMENWPRRTAKATKRASKLRDATLAVVDAASGRDDDAARRDDVPSASAIIASLPRTTLTSDGSMRTRRFSLPASIHRG